jgi:hypothetical protein
MSRYVFVRDTLSVREPGAKFPTMIRRGEAWHAESALVLAHPELFCDVPLVVHGQPPGAEVEQASAAPGERRATKRGS